MNRSSYLFEKVSSPDNLSCFWRHVSDNRGILFCMLIKLFLYAFKFCSICMEDVIVFILEIMPERISFQNILKFCQELQRVLNISELCEILVNEFLKLVVKSWNFYIKFNIIFVKFCFFKCKKIMFFVLELIHFFVEFTN